MFLFPSPALQCISLSYISTLTLPHRQFSLAVQYRLLPIRFYILLEFGAIGNLWEANAVVRRGQLIPDPDISVGSGFAGQIGGSGYFGRIRVFGLNSI